MRYLIYVMEDGRKWYLAAEVTVLGKLSVALVLPEEMRRARRVCSRENAELIAERMWRWGYAAGVEEDNKDNRMREGRCFYAGTERQDDRRAGGDGRSEVLVDMPEGFADTAAGRV